MPLPLLTLTRSGPLLPSLEIVDVEEAEPGAPPPPREVKRLLSPRVCLARSPSLSRSRSRSPYPTQVKQLLSRGGVSVHTLLAPPPTATGSPGTAAPTGRRIDFDLDPPIAEPEPEPEPEAEPDPELLEALEDAAAEVPCPCP